MDSEWLFLKRVDQIALLSQGSAPDRLQLLDLGGLLRQVLFDHKALVDTVNRNKVPLRFEVLENVPLGPQDSLSFVVGVDQISGAPANRVALLTKNQFGQHVVAHFGGSAVTIRDIVRFSANVAGGVHFDPEPRPEYGPAKWLYESILADDVPMLLYALPAIARAALRGLQPLYDDVQKRVAARSP